MSAVTWWVSSADGRVTGTFEQLGLGGLVRTRVNQADDTATFVQPGQAFDSDPLFAYDSTVVIKRNNARWFYGRVIAIPRSGDGSQESISYQLAGPWWYLAKCIYQQVRRVYDVKGAQIVNQNASRVILSQDVNGNHISNGEQIEDAIDFAIAQGAPIRRGRVDPAIDLPWEEFTDITCADVIITMLRLSPDYSCYFDYTTTPFPTLHCRARADLPVLTLDIRDTNEIAGQQVTARHDRLVPGVILTYEQTDTVDGVSYETVETDEAGDVDELDTLRVTIPLAGSHTRHVTQRIVTEAWPGDLNDKTWWAAHVPWLAEIAAEDFTIHDAARANGTYNQILLQGTIQDWMTNYHSADEKLTAQVDYISRDGAADDVHVIRNKEVTVSLIETDAVTGTYRKVSDYEEGEPIPVGLAAALYASWSRLQYDGEITTIVEEVGGSIYPGAGLSISGGRSEWVGMDAMIQQVTEQVEQGQTVAVFGPARHLGAIDHKTLLHTLRNRKRPERFVSRTTAIATDAGVTDLAGPVAKNEVTSGGGETTKQLVTDDSGAHQKRISLDPSQIVRGDAAVNMVPRVVYIYDPVTHFFYKREVLCSVQYGDPEPLRFHA